MTRVTQPALPRLQENLYMLAMLAMMNTGAEGFAIFRKAGHGSLDRRDSFGVPIYEENLLSEVAGEDNSLPVVMFSLRLRAVVDGAIAFAFASKDRLDAAQPRLVRHVAAISKLWGVQSLPHAYLTPLQRIIELEEDLIYSKISTVARGALSGDGDSDSADAVFRHVETILRPSNTLRTLETLLETLIAELQERSWIDQAKEILNAASGMTEWEAHSHLRKISRTSRRPLADVARQIVQDAEIRAGTND